MPTSKAVSYVAVLVEHTPLQIADQLMAGMKLHMETCDPIPEGITKGTQGEEGKITYKDYRQGLYGACADIVICTKTPSGEWKVLLSKRDDSVCFGGTWWIHGGAVWTYHSIDDFVAERAEKECGVPVRPEAILGVYCTLSEAIVGATLQPCFMAWVKYEDIERKMRKMRTDSGHTNVRLFSLEELEVLPEAEKHWYPYRVANLAIAACKIAG